MKLVQISKKMSYSSDSWNNVARELKQKPKNIREELKRMVRENNLNESKQFQIEKLKNDIVDQIRDQLIHLNNMQNHFNATIEIYKRVLEARHKKLSREFGV